MDEHENKSPLAIGMMVKYNYCGHLSIGKVIRITASWDSEYPVIITVRHSDGGVLAFYEPYVARC